MSSHRHLFVLVVAVSLVACGNGPEVEPEPEPVVASAPSRWVRVHVPSDLSLVEAPARVVSTAVAMGEVTPTMTMRVASVHVAPGQHVEAGDPILDAVIPEALSAAASWISAQRQLGVHRDRRTTLEGLRSEGMIEESTVFEQTARTLELSADQAQALAILQSVGVPPSDVARTLRAGTITLRAPLAGVVRELDVRLGEVRQAGDHPFARIVGVATPRIEARASRPIPDGTTAIFVGTDGTELPLAPAMSSVLDPVDGTYVAWLDPTRAAPNVVDGLRGSVRWTLEEGEALEVPARALRMEPERTVVMRRNGEVGEPVEVHVIAASHTTAIVTGALTLEDEVAEDAATVLRAPEEVEE